MKLIKHTEVVFTRQDLLGLLTRFGIHLEPGQTVRFIPTAVLADETSPDSPVIRVFIEDEPKVTQ